MAKIHPTAVIEGDVELGSEVVIGPMCYLKGPLIIGEGTQVGASCVIGTDGEHKTRPPAGVVRIGRGTTVRELTVIQRGTGDHDTTVGDRCFVMDHCHIAHDVVIHDDVTMSPNVVLGGHTHVHEGVTVGIAAVVHQFSTIGAYAMIGMSAVVTRDIPPLSVVAGNPARFLRLNHHQMTPRGWQSQQIAIVDERLTTTNQEIQRLIEIFEKDVRRKILPISNPND